MVRFTMKGIFGFIVLAVLISGIDAHAMSVTTPFMTVDEIVSIHPEQGAIMDAFNELARKPGKRRKATPKTPVKIAFIYPGNQISDYWRRSITSFKKRMDEIGLRYTISEYFHSPSDDPALQNQQVMEALEGDPDYLVFTLDVFKHKGVIDKLLQRKRPKLILQNITTPLREWEGRQPFLYVGFDHGIGSKMLADHYISKTGGEGDYGLLYFTRGYVSTMRGDTFRMYVESTSRLNLINAAYTDGKSDKAYEATIGMLNRFNPKFVYACSTDVAMGAIKAIKESGRDVMVNGWGGGSSELEAILAGDMDVTVMRMNDDNGAAMAEAIRLDLEGKENEVPTVYSGDMVLVEKGIAKKELDALIKRAFRYSGK